MKKFNIAVILIAFLLSVLFAGFGRNTEIADFDTVSGISIDKDAGKWTVTCEISKPSKDDPFGSKNEYVKGEGFTLEDAFRNASEKTDKIFNTDSVRIFIVSDSLKPASEVQSFFLNNDVNMRAVAIYCEGKASKLLDAENEGAAKSIYLTDKIKRFCFDMKKPVPKVISFLKDSSDIYLSDEGIPERSDL